MNTQATRADLRAALSGVRARLDAVRGELSTFWRLRERSTGTVWKDGAGKPAAYTRDEAEDLARVADRIGHPVDIEPAGHV